MYQRSTVMSSAPVPSVFTRVFLASDHAGFERKSFILKQLTAAQIDVVDLGPLTYDPADDYPRTVRPAALRVQAEPQTCAIIIGKSGQGEAMVANRVPGVRAAVYAGGGLELVDLARAHNDANVLSLGAGFVTNEEGWDAVQRFIATPASTDERHVRRRAQIDG